MKSVKIKFDLRLTIYCLYLEQKRRRRDSLLWINLDSSLNHIFFSGFKIVYTGLFGVFKTVIFKSDENARAHSTLFGSDLGIPLLEQVFQLNNLRYWSL